MFKPKQYKYYKFQCAVFFERAEKDDAEAQKILGDIFRYGLAKGIRKNYRQAIVWYQKGSDNGNALATLELAKTFALSEKNLGAKKDSHKAITLYKEAYAKGVSEAKHLLVLEYIKTKDYDTARKLLDECMEKDYSTYLEITSAKLAFEAQDYQRACDEFDHLRAFAESKKYIRILKRKGFKPSNNN